MEGRSLLVYATTRSQLGSKGSKEIQKEKKIALCSHHGASAGAGGCFSAKAFLLRSPGGGSPRHAAGPWGWEPGERRASRTGVSWAKLSESAPVLSFSAASAAGRPQHVV